MLALLGDVTVTGSTVSGNRALGGDSAGVWSFTGDVSVSNSTVSGNTTAATGAGVIAHDGDVTVVNSTVTLNVAAVCCGGIASQIGSVTLVYVTVVNNSASAGASNVTAGTDLISFGTVVALPNNGLVNCVVEGTTVSNGYNFDDGASCGFGGTSDRPNGGNPQLGALAANGGPTLTLLPLTGSPLINAIPAAACQADGAAGITADQRGTVRPQGSGCDIGAVEVVFVAPAAIVITPRFTG